MLLAIAHFIPDEDDPYRIVAELMEPMPSGSYLIMSHASSDIEAGRLTAAVQRYNKSSAVQAQMWSRDQFARFFDGLEIIEPGVVPLGLWQPDLPADGARRRGLPTYTAVARKP